MLEEEHCERRRQGEPLSCVLELGRPLVSSPPPQTGIWSSRCSVRIPYWWMDPSPLASVYFTRKSGNPQEGPFSPSQERKLLGPAFQCLRPDPSSFLQLSFHSFRSFHVFICHIFIEQL